MTVRALELLRLDLPAVRFRVRCSSGTYVRSLASDVGDALGVGAHLTELRRTSIGHVSVDAALPAGRLGERAAVEEARLGMLEALRHLPTVRVDRDAAARLAHGQRLRLEQDAPSGVVAVETEGELLAVGEVGEGVLRPRKVLGG